MKSKARAITGLVALSIALAAGLGRANAEQWGGLKGRFVFDGQIPKPKAIAGLPTGCGNALFEEDLVVDSSGGLANVVVFVRGNVPVHPDYEESKSDTVTLEIKGCRFEPHVLGMRVGQTLVLKNSDDHLAQPSLLGKRLDVNPLLRSGESFKVAVDEPQVLPVIATCNIHPWMSARLLVRRNPYFAISMKDGTFEIKKLPAGEMEFIVYHERAGYIREAELNGKKVEWPNGRIKINVKADESTDLSDIKLAAKLFHS